MARHTHVFAQFIAFGGQILTWVPIVVFVFLMLVAFIPVTSCPFCQTNTNLQTRIPMVGISNLNVELRSTVQHVLGHWVALHFCFCVGFSFVFLCSLRSMSNVYFIPIRVHFHVSMYHFRVIYTTSLDRCLGQKGPRANNKTWGISETFVKFHSGLWFQVKQDVLHFSQWRGVFPNIISFCFFLNFLQHPTTLGHFFC